MIFGFNNHHKWNDKNVIRSFRLIWFLIRCNKTKQFLLIHKTFLGPLIDWWPFLGSWIDVTMQRSDILGGDESDCQIENFRWHWTMSDDEILTTHCQEQILSLFYNSCKTRSLTLYVHYYCRKKDRSPPFFTWLYQWKTNILLLWKSIMINIWGMLDTVFENSQKNVALTTTSKTKWESLQS